MGAGWAPIRAFCSIARTAAAMITGSNCAGCPRAGFGGFTIPEGFAPGFGGSVGYARCCASSLLCTRLKRFDEADVTSGPCFGPPRLLNRCRWCGAADRVVAAPNRASNARAKSTKRVRRWSTGDMASRAPNRGPKACGGLARCAGHPLVLPRPLASSNISNLSC